MCPLPDYGYYLIFFCIPCHREDFEALVRYKLTPSQKVEYAQYINAMRQSYIDGVLEFGEDKDFVDALLAFTAVLMDDYTCIVKVNKYHVGDKIKGIWVYAEQGKLVFTNKKKDGYITLYEDDN